MQKKGMTKHFRGEYGINYYLYELNKKDLLQTLRLQTSVLSLNQHSYLTFHQLLLRCNWLTRQTVHN